MLPTFVKERMNSIPNFKAWADAVLARKSVTESFDVEANVKRTKARLAQSKK